MLEVIKLFFEVEFYKDLMFYVWVVLLPSIAVATIWNKIELKIKKARKAKEMARKRTYANITNLESIKNKRTVR